MTERRIGKVMICGAFRPSVEWLCEAWAAGLEAHDVAVERFAIAEQTGRAGAYLQYQLAPAFLTRRDNARLLAQAAQSRPDVVLIYQGLGFRRETVAHLARHAWVAGYANDDPFASGLRHRIRWRHFVRSLDAYSSHHVYRPVNGEEYRRRGVRHVGVLMSYYVPWLHRPPELTADERARHGHDVVFIGHAARDHRLACLRAVLAAGFRVRVFHRDVREWQRVLTPDEFARIGPVGPVFGRDYAATVAASRICLCFLSRMNRDQYTRRVFEIPACGGFLLAERTPRMQSLYREGEEADFFASPEELVAKVRFYLTHEDRRQAVAARGRRRCTRDGHDVVTRMKQWLTDTERFMAQETGPGSQEHA